MDPKFEFYVHFNPMRVGYEFYMFKGEHMATNITMAPREYSMSANPLMTISREELQQLANQLWEVGIRPEQSKQSHGAFEAQGKHLEDMRKIVFDQLELNK